MKKKKNQAKLSVSLLGKTNGKREEPPLLEIKDLSKDYSDKPVLKDISFTLNDNEILGVIGPSGAGKSTLLRCISRLEDSTKGNMFFEGGEHGANSDIGIVFQDLQLWPHRTVLQNIIDTLIHVKRYKKEKAIDIGKGLLRQFDLQDKENEYPKDLSGGEKQRVAIARALATNPKLLLLDEITSSLDPELIHELLYYIRSLSKQGKSMVVVSHHMGFIRQLADRVIFLENGAIIEENNAEELFRNPKNERTKKFIEKNLVGML
ncbi:amino acid ABC transporter ATP-binding protein [Candidatus Micrarchaeota archaeon]|nr:amino acid ABC transporter ATP-binding protein [Candidatus Micrarchaeota archaeon]